MADHAAETIAARAALLETRERLRLIDENASSLAFFITDPDGIVVEWSESARSVFGYPPEDIVGRDFAMLFLPEDREAGAPERERLAARADGKASDRRWHLRKDGSRVFIDGALIALRDGRGTVTGFLKIGRDVTELHAFGRRQDMLVTDAQHRIRNALAVVRSIVRRTAENCQSVEDMAAHLQGRIDALARGFAGLGRDLDSGIDLAGLIADEMLAHAVSEGEQLSIKGPDVVLRGKAAEALSLTVHELTTNAVKFGALSVRGGKVGVEWSHSAEGDGELRLVWEEQGRDQPLIIVAHSGFGFEYLQHTLPYEMEAQTEIEFLDAGLRFTLIMALPDAGGVAPAA